LHWTDKYIDDTQTKHNPEKANNRKHSKECATTLVCEPKQRKTYVC